jgi:hypothetical protein
MFTVLSAMILIASMTPRGALRLNPSIISDQIGHDFEEVTPPEQFRLGKSQPTATEKDEFSSSIAATEPDTKHDTNYEVTSDASPTTPTSPTSPMGSPTSQLSPVFNSADDRERERQRRPKSVKSEQHQLHFETRVHMPTGIRVDLNVSARALPIPPQLPGSPVHSPH